MSNFALPIADPLSFNMSCEKETMTVSRVYDCDSLINEGVRSKYIIKAMREAYQP